MNDRDKSLSDAREEERVRYARAKRAEAFERRRARCLNTLVGPRCDHLAADADPGSDPGLDSTGFSNGVI